MQASFRRSFSWSHFLIASFLRGFFCQLVCGSLFCFVCCFFTACGSSGPRGENGEKMRFGTDVDYSGESTAPGDAYAADSFTFRKWQPMRYKNSDIFYYKTCEAVDGKAYYSKTSYECTEP